MKCQNIIYIKNDVVKVFQFREKAKRFEYLKRDGQKSYPITDDFWEWWAKQNDFVKKEDELDVCFIYDKENLITSAAFLNEVNMVEKSEWNQEKLQNFFSQIMNETVVEMRSENGNSVLLRKEESNGSTEKKVYYTNVHLEEQGSLTIANEGNEDEMTGFALYFRDLRRREREQ